MYMNTDMYIYTYRYTYMCVYVCVFEFLLCGAVSCRVSRVVGGWVVGCGVVDMSLSWWSLSLCRGPSHCVVMEKQKEEERARKKWREGR